MFGRRATSRPGAWQLRSELVNLENYRAYTPLSLGFDSLTVRTPYHVVRLPSTALTSASNFPLRENGMLQKSVRSKLYLPRSEQTIESNLVSTPILIRYFCEYFSLDSLIHRESIDTRAPIFVRPRSINRYEEKNNRVNNLISVE